MNIQEKLLHNEIQNLGQMVQIVSYELTLLSDFMKEKFGSSYQSFREKHSQQAADVHRSFPEPEKASGKKPNLTARKSTSPLKRPGDPLGSSLAELKRIKRDTDEDDGGGIDDTMWESDGALDVDDYEEAGTSGVGDDLQATISGEEDEGFAVPPVVEETDVPKGAQLMVFTKPDPDEKVVGRARSGIWSKYIVSKLANGKLHAKCHRCKNPVSCKVERLKGHYRKCVLGQTGFSKAIGKPYKTAAEISLEEEDKRKVTEMIRSMNHSRSRGSSSHVDDGDVQSTSAPTQSSSTPEEKRGNEGAIDQARGGRKADPVWEYFKILEDPETKRKIVKCKRCDVTVSSKVERVRRHFVICQELDREGEGATNG